MRTLIKPIYERDVTTDLFVKKDFFKREELITNLTNLFLRSDNGLVVTINANWGSGKTFFIKMWESKLLSENQFIPIYYDAYKNDFSQNVLMSIGVMLNETINNVYEKCNDNYKRKQQKKYLKKAFKEVAKDFLRTSTNAAVGVIAFSVSGNNSFSDWIKKSFKKLFWGTIDLNINAQYDSFIKLQQSVDNYQKLLKDILQKEGNTKKIVFFIDELDRCRPNFAIEILEKIKHLFTVDNIFFVLSINKEQLVSIIRNAYGVSIDDAEIYLQKFVHIEANLPSISQPVNNYESLVKYIDDLFNEYQIRNDFKIEDELKNQLCVLLSDRFLNMNPRTIERYFSLLSIAMGSISEKFWALHKKSVLIMPALKVGDEELYELYKGGTIVKQHKEKGKYFDWLKEYFIDVNQTASNVFEVAGVSEVCKIIDLFKIGGHKK